MRPKLSGRGKAACRTLADPIREKRQEDLSENDSDSDWESNTSAKSTNKRKTV